MLGTLLAAALLAPAWTPGVRAAERFASGRQGTVAFAVRTEERLWGRAADVALPSASVVKALLMVAYLRDPAVRDRPLRRDEQRLLSPMIRWSQNRAASELVGRMGAERIEREAHRNGMPSFRLASPWGHSPITAREQTRFMLRIDRRLPPRHREYAMGLLETVVHTQRWGIPAVAPRGWALAFKGGWGRGPGRVHHQVALLRRGRERVAVAILTGAQGTHRYGAATLRGVAARLLRRLASARPIGRPSA